MGPGPIGLAGKGVDEDRSTGCMWIWYLNGLPSPSSFAASRNRAANFSRIGGVNPTNLDNIFGSLNPAILPQLQSPTGMQMRKKHEPTGAIKLLCQHVILSCTEFWVDGSSAASVLSSRLAAFAKKSQSFIERGASNRNYGFSSSTDPGTLKPPNHSDWGSLSGKLDWGIQEEELNKLRKSASFGFRSNGSNFSTASSIMPANIERITRWMWGRNWMRKRSGFWSEGRFHNGLSIFIYYLAG